MQAPQFSQQKIIQFGSCIFFPTDDSDGGGKLLSEALRVRGEERGHRQDALQG